jgi:hypothetical protein
MTWDLAESGKHFITTVINGSDLVPTFSAASVDDLRTEVLKFVPERSNIDVHSLPSTVKLLTFKWLSTRLQHLHG